MRLMIGRMVRISPVSPELEIASTMSGVVIMPRSPCEASPGCTKNAGVPVLARVAAILPPMCPDLPMPVTMTRPGAGENQAAGPANCPSRRSPASAAPRPRAGSPRGPVVRTMRMTSCVSRFGVGWGNLSRSISKQLRLSYMEPIGFHSILILLGVAVVLVALFRYLRLPQMLAYLCAGIARRAVRHGLDPGPGRHALPRRVRTGVPDVHHRPGILAAASSWR